MTAIIILLIVCILLLIMAIVNQNRIKWLKEDINEWQDLSKIKDKIIYNEKKNIQLLCNQIKEQK